MGNKLLIIADEWFPVIGGLEKHLHHIAKEFSKESTDVVVITIKDAHSRTELPYTVIASNKERFINNISAVSGMLSDEDVVYCARLFNGVEIPQLYALKGCRAKVILRLPSTWNYQRYSNKLYSELLNKSIDGFICLNERTKKVIESRFPSKRSWLSYNTHKTDEQKLSPNIGSDFLWAGRFCESKNIRNLIVAWKEICKEGGNRNARLVLRGGEYQSIRLKKWIFSEISDCNNIFLVENKVASSLIDLSHFKYLLLPSYREGCPNILVEAYSNKTPVIGSDVHGVGEHIKGANGILIEKPLGVYEIKIALQEALSIDENSYWNMCKNSHKYYIDRFSQDKVYHILGRYLYKTPNKELQRIRYAHR